MTTIVFFFFLPVLVILLLGLNNLLAVKKPDSQKNTIYESGFEPVQEQTRINFPIPYFMVGILFLVFDLEIAVFFPLSVTLNYLESYGYWVGIIFFILLTFGFVYEVGSGALKYTTD